MSDFAAGLSTILSSLDQQTTLRLLASRSALEQVGDNAEVYMEAAAAWTDRSGDARTGLESTPIHPPELRDGGMIALHHSVSYGEFLEKQPKYAIVEPAALLAGPQLMVALGDIW